MNTRLAANMAVNAFKAITRTGRAVAGYGGAGAELMGAGGFGKSMQQFGVGVGQTIQGLKRGASFMPGVGLRGSGASSSLAAGRAGRRLTSMGMENIRGAGRGFAEWGAGAGTTMGQRAARLGGGYVAGRSAADFMNPWGLGWGD